MSPPLKAVVRALCTCAALLSPLAPTSAQAQFALDTTPPSVTILQPTSGAVVKDSVPVEATADDGLLGTGVTSVEYQVNSTLGAWQPMSYNLLSLSWRATWDTTLTRDGSVNVYVRATDMVGNVRTAYVPVRVVNAPAAPTGLAVTAPAAPSQGGYLDLTWAANSEPDLAGYVVYRGTTAGGPYVRVGTSAATTFRDSGVTNGTRYFYVLTAQDTAGNESPRSSEASGKAADTLAPTLSAVSATADETTADIRWTTSEPATTQVEYGTSATLGTVTPLDTTLVTEHAVRLTGLQPSTTYSFRVRSTDGAGNAAASQVLTFTTVVNQPPVVTIVAPAEGAVLDGTVVLRASVTDDAAGLSVEYTVDGYVWSPLGFNSLTGSYEVRLDTTALEEGPHQLGVRATDVGNLTDMDVVSVMVDRAAPALTLVSPEVDAHLPGGATHLIQVKATDSGAGIASVEWQLYEVPFGVEAPETTPPPNPDAWQPLTLNPDSGMYETGWLAPLIVSERIYFIYVRARDAAGKLTSTDREFSIIPTGRDYSFIGSGGQEVFGTVAIEPIRADGGNRIGIDMRGLGLTPGGVYTLTVSGPEGSHTVQLTGDSRGRGVVTVEEDTGLPDEFSATLTVTGPGF